MTGETMRAAPGSVPRAHRAVLVVFTTNGIAFATWASRIPDIKSGIGLTPGQLGVILLFASVGSLIGLPASGWLADRFGAARVVTLGLAIEVTGLTVAGLGASLASSAWVVAAGLFGFGLGNGLWDVGMNLEGATVERLRGRTSMPHYHAAFSAGSVLGALVGAGMSWGRVPVAVHLVLASAVIAIVTLGGVRTFLPRRVVGQVTEGASGSRPEGDAGTGARSDEGSGPSSGTGPAPDGGPPRRRRGQRRRALQAWREPRTLLIGVFVLVAAFTEGTANDWISVALVEGYAVPAWAGVLGFATFLVSMTTGRVVGTYLLDRWGRVPVLRTLVVAAGLGSLLVVLGTTPLAYLGAAVWGFGTSLGFPVGMSAAADEPDLAPVRMSVVATIGYAAFLGGPPLIGFLGDHVGVRDALLAVAALLVVALAVLPVIREPQTARSGGTEVPR